MLNTVYIEVKSGLYSNILYISVVSFFKKLKHAIILIPTQETFALN